MDRISSFLEANCIIRPDTITHIDSLYNLFFRTAMTLPPLARHVFVMEMTKRYQWFSFDKVTGFVSGIYLKGSSGAFIHLSLKEFLIYLPTNTSTKGPSASIFSKMGHVADLRRSSANGPPDLVTKRLLQSDKWLSHSELYAIDKQGIRDEAVLPEYIIDLSFEAPLDPMICSEYLTLRTIGLTLIDKLATKRETLKCERKLLLEMRRVNTNDIPTPHEIAIIRALRKNGKKLLNLRYKVVEAIVNHGLSMDLANNFPKRRSTNPNVEYLTLLQLNPPLKATSRWFDDILDRANYLLDYSLLHEGKEILLRQRVRQLITIRDLILAGKNVQDECIRYDTPLIRHLLPAFLAGDLTKQEIVVTLLRGWKSIGYICLMELIERNMEDVIRKALLNEGWASLSPKGYPDYEISSEGRLRKVDGAFLHASMRCDRYYAYTLRNINGSHVFTSHSLVTDGFLPPSDGVTTIDHINGRTDDNRLCNLRRATATEQANNRKPPKERIRPILQYLNGVIVRKLDSFHELSEELYVSQIAFNLVEGFKGFLGGYEWAYEENVLLPGEHWKKISRYISIFVSTLGRIYHIERNIATYGHDGIYRHVIIRGKEESNHESVHRLVMEAFNGPSDLIVNHIDGNKHNNELPNLVYATHSQNTQHAHDTGLIAVRCKPVVKLNHEEKIVSVYSSIKSAANDNAVSPDNIKSSCESGVLFIDHYWAFASDLEVY